MSYPGYSSTSSTKLRKKAHSQVHNNDIEEELIQRQLTSSELELLGHSTTGSVSNNKPIKIKSNEASLLSSSSTPTLIKKKKTNESQTHVRPEEDTPNDLEDEITYLFPDCKTLKTLCSRVSQRHHTVRLKGYEIYIVEQWACARKLSSVILLYTGNSEHQVEMISVRLPKNKELWKDCFKSLLGEVVQTGAKEKVTEEGIVHITNLASFPSHLNLLPVPSGSSLTVWEHFKVNVNLRRLNCLGRSALILGPPTDATENKFRQLYRIDSKKVNIYYAVEELVTLIQIVLVDFKLHDPNLVDGLLCDMTERNIQSWWAKFGSFCFMKPKDGVLGPSTVSFMIGFVLSCSFRLDIAGADFPKEPFNYVNFRVNVGKFQKQNNLEQTWYLDARTVDRLFKETSKIPTSDISKLKNVVKSRVNDISRRANFNVIANDVLTTDLERTMKFFHYSARLDYMWNGKGDVRDLKKFDYIFDEDIPNYGANSYSLRSSVGKIKKIPKKLNDDYNPNSSSRKSKKSKSTSRTLDAIDCQDVAICPLDSTASPTSATGGNVCIVSSSIEPVALPATDPNASSNPACISVSEEFTRNIHRRNSFPFTPEELNIPQLKYENHTAKLNMYSPTIRIKRSKSFSVVESTLSRYDPLPPTPIKLIQILKGINLKLRTQAETQTRYMKLKSDFEDSISHIAARTLKLTTKNKPLFYNADIQFQANERLNFKMEDMEHLGSRLQYEMRVLGNTVRDTKDGIDVFIAKMEVLENLLDERCKEGDCQNGWISWLSQCEVWGPCQRYVCGLFQGLTGKSGDAKDQVGSTKDQLKTQQDEIEENTLYAGIDMDSDSLDSSDTSSIGNKISNDELITLKENQKDK
ncbi:hypothetical protein WICPIJ_003303 [Wickerhamomyces pijperi]|uniref:STB6-like N-terminal domain-containing protein n=1 Tax=Wickerhamomyces pijperi TaxID=599730 RepID=A0A9P8Q7K1_WICPI|nr:hypothetical protein WICPIJ_003303 [Wickerhamomyces pijperi]